MSKYELSIRLWMSDRAVDRLREPFSSKSAPARLVRASRRLRWCDCRSRGLEREKSVKLNLTLEWILLEKKRGQMRAEGMAIAMQGVM
jgi:hypothetical protein